MFFHKFNLTMDQINNLPNKITDLKNVDINELSDPGWDTIFENYTPKFKF